MGSVVDSIAILCVNLSEAVKSSSLQMEGKEVRLCQAKNNCPIAPTKLKILSVASVVDIVLTRG